MRCPDYALRNAVINQRVHISRGFVSFLRGKIRERWNQSQSPCLLFVFLFYSICLSIAYALKYLAEKNGERMFFSFSFIILYLLYLIFFCVCMLKFRAPWRERMRLHASKSNSWDSGKKSVWTPLLEVDLVLMM